MSNVKPGDIAQVVKAFPPYEWTLGRVVVIKEPCCQTLINRIVWEFAEPLRNEKGETSKCAADICLKKLPDLKDDDSVHIDKEEPLPTKKIIPIREEA